MTLHASGGKSFGISKQLLSRHILLLGGIDIGKTNVFRLILKDLFSKRDTQIVS